MTRRTIAAIETALLTSGLAACSHPADEQPAAENRVEAAPSPAPVAVDTPHAPAPSRTPRATPSADLTAETPAAVAPAPDEQMMEDASATGMTARSSREEASPSDPAPVEQVERK